MCSFIKMRGTNKVEVRTCKIQFCSSSKKIHFYAITFPFGKSESAIYKNQIEIKIRMAPSGKYNLSIRIIGFL